MLHSWPSSSVRGTVVSEIEEVKTGGHVCSGQVDSRETCGYAEGLYIMLQTKVIEWDK
jgi:hypothetical protein